MKVVIVTSGRFHSFDQARQLRRKDAFEEIFTGFPHAKIAREGFSRDLVRRHPYWQPLVHLARRREAAVAIRRELEWRAAQGLDAFAARNLPPCDALIALSSTGLRVGTLAQERGAAYLCDRGSTHIRYQEECLRREFERYGKRYFGIDPRKIEKEEAEYARADRILVPSRFARRTFLERGFAPEKVCLAPYGVDLARFKPVAEPPEDFFEVLFVGALTIRKGIRDLLEAFDRFDHPRKRLTLVGAPSRETADEVARALARSDVRATGSVSQDEVRERMSRSHAMVLPSVEEGLALVQGQAMACGLPVIATPNTGSEDLFTDGREGFIVPVHDPAAIADRLTRLADEPRLRREMGARGVERVESLGGWDAYGDALYALLQELTGKK